MPPILAALPFVAAEALGIQFLGLLRANYRDFIILATKSAAAVGNRVDVQLGSGRFARQLAQALSELLLKIIVEAVLLAEEDNAALRDCSKSVPVCIFTITKILVCCTDGPRRGSRCWDNSIHDLKSAKTDL